MKYYSTVKKSEIFTFACKQMKQGKKLSNVSQVQKDKRHMFSLSVFNLKHKFQKSERGLGD